MAEAFDGRLPAFAVIGVGRKIDASAQIRPGWFAKWWAVGPRKSAMCVKRA